MSVKIVCDRLILPRVPYALNPTTLANELTRPGWTSESHFSSSVVVKYSPNVSTATTGETTLAVGATPYTNAASAHAAACKIVTPVWKGATLVIPLALLNFEDWARDGSPHLWLSAIGVSGTVDISCTLRCMTQLCITPIPTQEEQLAHLDTHCFVGPVLEGFSLVGCLPRTLQPQWGGAGQVINIDLLNGKGRTSGNRYIPTPSNKPYVAVRYGFGSSFSYVYNSKNKPYTWQSNTKVIWSYTERDAGTGATGVSYFASWRPVHGSTDWWAEINPTNTSYVLGGVTFNWYYPCTQLILYYHFPGVDIFAKDFTPAVQVEPTTTLPCPPGDAEPNKPQMLPLNNSKMQSLLNAWWNPKLDLSHAGSDLKYRFTQAKYALTKWPVNCTNNKMGAFQKESVEEMGLGTSKDAEVFPCEMGWERTDSSA